MLVKSEDWEPSEPAKFYLFKLLITEVAVWGLRIKSTVFFFKFVFWLWFGGIFSSWIINGSSIYIPYWCGLLILPIRLSLGFLNEAVDLLWRSLGMKPLYEFAKLCVWSPITLEFIVAPFSFDGWTPGYFFTWAVAGLIFLNLAGDPPSGFV